MPLPPSKKKANASDAIRAFEFFLSNPLDLRLSKCPLYETPLEAKVSLNPEVFINNLSITESGILWIFLCTNSA